MIQRKAPAKPKSSIHHKKIHGGCERTSGGADLKKKLEKAKSNKVFDFDCFEQSRMDIQFKNTSTCKKISSSSTPIRNYMKPTSSSDARKEKLQVTATSRAVKALSRQSSLKVLKSSMKKNANRATCSSTLKNSKFPAALELNHGATEAEGTSKIRVCAYAYCSLNGHMHEPLPPLKYFISARRNLLKRMIDDGELEDEIEYSGETKPQMNDSPYISFGYDCVMDQNGEFSQEEMDDGSINFLEYVAFDHARTTAQKDSEEDGEINKSEIEAMDMNWEDEQISVDEEDDTESEEEDSETSEFGSQSIDHEVQKLPSETMNWHSDESCLRDDSKNLEKVLQEDSNGTDRDILNVAAVDYKEIDGILKRTTEEFEQVKEFNPRPPNFLPLEPDPEAEKVDLRHQTMDERRNSEEWMIDYALQQAVTKLGSVRKKKVALLVQAFETITPLPLRENCLSHGASTSNHLSFLQACN